MAKKNTSKVRKALSDLGIKFLRSTPRGLVGRIPNNAACETTIKRVIHAYGFKVRFTRDYVGFAIDLVVL